MGNNIRSSSRPKALAPSIPMPPLADAMDAVHLSVDRFCLLAGVEALAEMMEEDATTVCWGPTSPPWEPSGLSLGPYAEPDRRSRRPRESAAATGSRHAALRWVWRVRRHGATRCRNQGMTRVGAFQPDRVLTRVDAARYRPRGPSGPEGDLAKARGHGWPRSRPCPGAYVALSRKPMKAWLASDLSELDLLALSRSTSAFRRPCPDGGRRIFGDKHVWPWSRGRRRSTVDVQALIDNLLRVGGSRHCRG